jgi:hypothetical protein
MSSRCSGADAVLAAVDARSGEVELQAAAPSEVDAPSAGARYAVDAVIVDARSAAGAPFAVAGALIVAATTVLDGVVAAIGTVGAG